MNVFDGGQVPRRRPQSIGDRPGWGQHQILLQSRTGEWWAATEAGLCRFAPTSGGLAENRPRHVMRGTYVFRVFEDSGAASGPRANLRTGTHAAMGSRHESDFLVGRRPNGHQLVSAFAEDHNGASGWATGAAANYSVIRRPQFTALHPSMECRRVRSSRCLSISAGDCGSVPAPGARVGGGPRLRATPCAHV